MNWLRLRQHPTIGIRSSSPYKLQGLAPGAKSRHAADVQKSEESYEYATRVYQEREATRKQDLARGLEPLEQQNSKSVIRLVRTTLWSTN